METKFDSQAATSLLCAMNDYCSSIQKDAKDTLVYAKSLKGWNDEQHKQFVTSIELISIDLERILKIQSEYMNIFSQRIEELRG